MKARSITPSNPIISANGFRKFERIARIVLSPAHTFEHIHIKAPAGAATEIALPKIMRVLSRRERISVFKI